MPPFRETTAPTLEKETAPEAVLEKENSAETPESRALIERSQRLEHEAPRELINTVEKDHAEYSEKFGLLDNSVGEIYAKADRCEGILQDLESSLRLVPSEADRQQIRLAIDEARNAITDISNEYTTYQESFTPTHPNFVASEANLTRMMPFLEAELQTLKAQETNLQTGEITEEAEEAEKKATAVLNAINITTVKTKLVTPLEKSDWGTDSEQAYTIERLSAASEQITSALAQIQLALEGTTRIPQTLENRLIDLTEVKQVIDSESTYLKQKFALCRATREDMLNRYSRTQSNLQNLIG